ncbi:phospholipase D-like domain-containing protein [Mesorhizobium captivum]|uniref:phospholipase D-like domain-containing protein n=1 Tax=Mesorhizobium captivum TaxID=3072319 RepID=UPI002A23E335|nr:phospholipase D-like domain-containing protein [Mesorhizobium sp. VK3C]MDX8449832.1 phospholipase D-like domain-containing protein [Mesorhizobium sp. VK3C]
MRATETGEVLRVRAISGTYVVVLAWDFVEGQDAKKNGLMGFAIQREELQGDRVVERYWMTGIKRFRDKDKGLPPGTPVSTADHPMQAFQWADYTAETSHTYRYKVVPVYGEVKKLDLDEGSAISVTITTEIEYLLHPSEGNDTERHDVYFNRGVIGSQAYARRFGNRMPDRNNPAAEEMVWLSRGLFEALVKFINLAEDHHFGLRAAFYEFHYQPVANVFAKAVEAGADIKIVFDDEDTYKKPNELVIHNARLDEMKVVVPRTVVEGIRHNKFIVLLKDEQPIAVWTGSTNISDGGIFGHSNVGHIVWSSTIAEKYLKYWKLLAANKTPADLRPQNQRLTPLPAGRPGPDSITPLFSARDAKDSSTTMQWYADRMGEAKRISCITLAFKLDKLFSDVLQRQNDVLRYVVKDDDLGDGEIIGTDRDVIFAAGGHLEAGALADFLGERDNPLNSNNYIHDKFMLVDPLGKDPLIVTGSANFSQPSQRINDENMLVIRGDTRVADIYFGEFMRIFDHHYARYIIQKLTQSGRSDPDAGYLKTITADWLNSHFDDRSYKSKRRRYFLDEGD